MRRLPFRNPLPRKHSVGWKCYYRAAQNAEFLQMAVQGKTLTRHFTKLLLCSSTPPPIELKTSSLAVLGPGCRRGIHFTFRQTDLFIVKSRLCRPFKEWQYRYGLAEQLESWAQVEWKGPVSSYESTTMTTSTRPASCNTDGHNDANIEYLHS
ncbi:hypothetical protein BDR06DRAFT_566760 [Suillus hirtellus]|nr:hypothetical protein BDR06DRAFT_566760 [Suillus hirtellus]